MRTGLRLVTVSNSELLLRIDLGLYAERIGLAYHWFNFLVGLQYSTVFWIYICLFHESYYNII